LGAKVSYRQPKVILIPTLSTAANTLATCLYIKKAQMLSVWASKNIIDWLIFRFLLKPFVRIACYFMAALFVAILCLPLSITQSIQVLLFKGRL